MSNEREMDRAEYDALLTSLNGGGASTPDLHTFQRAWEFDSNFVWRISEGHTHNALEAALDEIERLKPRTITTAEELDALPVGSVVLDSEAGDAWQKLDADPVAWFVIGSPIRWNGTGIVGYGPYAILHEGGER